MLYAVCGAYKGMSKLQEALVRPMIVMALMIAADG